MGMSERFRLQPSAFKLPALRFRGKIMLGFMAVLAISAISMGIAYFGFERVSASVAAYRTSVTEVNLARNIDHGVILYRGLAQYYVVTGKEDDAKAALSAEVGLKDAIEQAVKDTTNPAGLDQVTKLSREFRIFTKIFADIAKVKGDSAFVAQNELERGGNMLRYKLDEIAGDASEAQLPAIELGVKQVIAQFQATTALANMFVVNSDQTVATGALARLKFVENAMHAISTDSDEIVQGLKEAAGLIDAYRKALNKLVDNAKSIQELTGEMSDSAAAIQQGSNAMQAALLAEQQRIEADSNAAIKGTERLIMMLAAGGFMLGAILAVLLGRGISRPMVVMCKAMRELAGGNFAVVLPGLGRKDEIGEMASAV
jgi:HAMP domain-containing protein